MVQLLYRYETCLGAHYNKSGTVFKNVQMTQITCHSICGQSMNQLVERVVHGFDERLILGVPALIEPIDGTCRFVVSGSFEVVGQTHFVVFHRFLRLLLLYEGPHSINLK